MTKPFRFGVQISNAASAAAWRDKARKLEDLGYSTLFMPDHFGNELAPMPAIAMAAAHTTTLRIGALVFDNDYKHPAILAKEAATIDLLSDGRLELGIGAGWMKTDYDALGLAVRPARGARRPVRGGAARRSSSASPASSSRITASTTASPTTRRTRSPCSSALPILIGGGGKRVLSIAAREADIVGINPNLRAGEVGARRDAGLAAGADRPQDRLGARRGRARASTTSRSRCGSSSPRSPTTA